MPQFRPSYPSASHYPNIYLWVPWGEEERRLQVLCQQGMWRREQEVFYLLIQQLLSLP